MCIHAMNASLKFTLSQRTKGPYVDVKKGHFSSHLFFVLLNIRASQSGSVFEVPHQHHCEEIIIFNSVLKLKQLLAYKLLLLVGGEASHLLFVCFHLLFIVLKVTHHEPETKTSVTLGLVLFLNTMKNTQTFQHVICTTQFSFQSSNLLTFSTHAALHFH